MQKQYEEIRGVINSRFYKIKINKKMIKKEKEQIFLNIVKITKKNDCLLKLY